MQRARTYGVPLLGDLGAALGDARHELGEDFGDESDQDRKDEDSDEKHPRPAQLPGKRLETALRAAGGQKPKRATVQEPCPYCNHPEVEYYTMQMRSADEGETVFYECPECGHKWNQNN